MIDEEIQRIVANAQLAVKMFADVENQELHFDEQSLAIVDAFINKKFGVFERATLNGLVSTLGAFLGECIRRNFGGKWDIIRGELCIRFSEGNAVFPFTKVRKHFEDGATDSILGFYQVLPDVYHL